MLPLWSGHANGARANSRRLIQDGTLSTGAWGAQSFVIRPRIIELLDELVRIGFCFTLSRIGVYGGVAHPTILENKPTVAARSVDISLDSNMTNGGLSGILALWDCLDS